MSDLSNSLKAPFSPSQISWRIGSTTADKSKGMALAYIDARDVMDRLDEVCGVEGWQCSYPHANGKTVCSIGIRIGGEWIWKADGAGDSDVEAEKGALSDAFKRAAVRWGIGRYLYDMGSPWVAIVGSGKSYRIADGEHAKLEAMLAKSAKTDDKPSLIGEPDATREMNDAIVNVRGCVSWTELEGYVKGRLKNTYSRLPAKHRGEITRAIEDQKKKLEHTKVAA